MVLALIPRPNYLTLSLLPTFPFGFTCHPVDADTFELFAGNVNPYLEKTVPGGGLK